MDEKEYVEVNLRKIVLDIPENAVELKIIATIYQDGALQKCEMIVSQQEIRDLLSDALLNYIDDDATFQITDAGRRWLEEQKVNVPTDHVQDYNELLQQIQQDPKFDRLINAMMLDQ